MLNGVQGLMIGDRPFRSPNGENLRLRLSSHNDDDDHELKGLTTLHRLKEHPRVAPQAPLHGKIVVVECGTKPLEVSEVQSLRPQDPR